MRITSLELQNIKSYAEPTTIDLSNGVNAVCGPNGSGKTTVLEAIGFALFDYLPYSQAAFLREGQKSGTVRVRLLARDGREYEVVRKVGSGATHYVADPETATRLADRKETLTWIREKALGLDGEADLATLFKNAIGVPQGLMTADFQGTPMSRKAIFDPILRVEEYRHAFEYLVDAVRYVRERSAQVDGEIKVLRDDVDTIPEREHALTELGESLSAGEERLARAVAERVQAEECLAGIEAVNKTLQTLENDLRQAEYEVQRYTDRVVRATDDLRAAERAREVVTAAEPGYRIVEEARERLRALEKRREERDRLQADLQGAQAERKGIFERIEALDKDLLDADEAALEAAGLVEAVARQTELEERQRDVSIKLSGLDAIEQRIGRLQQEVTRLQRGCEEREVALARARDEERRAVELPAAQAELDRIIGQLGQLEPLRQRQQAVESEGRTLRADKDRLAKEVERLTAIRVRLGEVEPAVGGFDDLVLRQRTIQERQTRLSAELAYQSYARQELEQEHCPLLDLRCPAVSADRDLLERLAEREEELSRDAQAVRAEIEAVEREVAAAAALREELRTLQVEAASLERAEQDLPRLDERLTECRREYADIGRQLDEERALVQQRGAVQATVQSLQAAARAAAGIELLETQLNRDREALQLQCEELTRLDAERAELGSIEQEAATVAEALAQLGDPRGRQQHLLALAARKPGIERALAEQHGRLNDAAGRVKAVVGRLQSFDGLDDEMAGEQAREAAHAEAHRQYLQHQAVAGEVEARAAALAESECELAVRAERHTALQAEWKDVAATYDAGAHEAARLAAEDARVLVAREETLLDQVREQEKRAERELADLRRKAEKLRQRENERDELVTVGRAIGFIRETIKAAGPAVTDSLLRNISAGANEIFAEIMDDHAAELRWDRDYEVLVQRGPETRKFPQLSGGEQMSAALSVRLALLKEMSEVDFAFFDEPTQNMDGERRSNLAGQISQVKGFDQLIVISHDDTFEHHTDNLIRLEKKYEETRVSGE